MKRREFLKTSALGLATAFLPVGLTRLAEGAAPEPARPWVHRLSFSCEDAYAFQRNLLAFHLEVKGHPDAPLGHTYREWGYVSAEFIDTVTPAEMKKMVMFGAGRFDWSRGRIYIIGFDRVRFFDPETGRATAHYPA